jgi:hypothetical protein
MFAFAAALALAQQPAVTAPASPVPRPTVELRCILDGVGEPVRLQAGAKFWNMDRTPPAPAEMLGAATRDCARRYSWRDTEIVIAGRYALSAAGLLYARAWLADQGLSAARWDEVYDGTPRAERLNPQGSDTLRQRSLALLAQMGGDTHLERMSAYMVMRRGLEQSEMEWTALPAPG